MSDYVPTSTYVPTLDEVETAFHEFASDLETRFPGEYESAPEFADWREAMHGFRRWLTEYTRVKQAEALEEFAERWATADGMEALMLATDAEEAVMATEKELLARAAEYRKGEER